MMDRCGLRRMGKSGLDRRQIALLVALYTALNDDKTDRALRLLKEKGVPALTRLLGSLKLLDTYAGGL